MNEPCKLGLKDQTPKKDIVTYFFKKIISRKKKYICSLRIKSSDNPPGIKVKETLSEKEKCSV